MKCIAIVNDCVSVLEACAVDEVDCAASFTLSELPDTTLLKRSSLALVFPFVVSNLHFNSNVGITERI